jgi:hypothetical protein
MAPGSPADSHGHRHHGHLKPRSSAAGEPGRDELAEIVQAIGRCRGDRIAAPKLTATWVSHLLISSRELLHNLLIRSGGARICCHPKEASTSSMWRASPAGARQKRPVTTPQGSVTL